MITMRWTVAVLWIAMDGVLAAAQARPDRIQDHLKTGRLTFELGTETEAGPELFGGIGSAAIDGNGAVYVLDVSDNSVRMFDARGRFLARAGRPGRGPGDLATPHQIFHDGDSSLFVIDAVNGVSVFHTTDAALKFAMSFGGELRPRSACLFGGNLVVAGYREGRMLHFVDERGNISRSIGGPFAIKPPPGVKYPVDTIKRLKEYANSGAPVLAVCSDQLDVIAVAQLHGPGLRAYRPNGQLVWSAELPGYHGHTFWESPQGRAVTVFGNDATRTLALLDSLTLLVQVSRRQTLPGRTNGGRQTRVQQLSMTSTLLDLRTGRVLASGTEFPQVLAVRDSTMVEGYLDPFPQIRVRSFSKKRR
jgi:hypothetical protein